MPSLNSLSGSSFVPPGKPIENAKSIVIDQVENGYALRMQKVDEYGQRFLVAKDLNEAQVLMGTYFEEGSVA